MTLYFLPSLFSYELETLTDTHPQVKKFVDSSTANEAEKGARELMERQANTMSMFTLVTSLFLPLGFFSSVGHPSTTFIAHINGLTR